MARYQQLFTQLSAKKEGAFIPFVVLGDPIERSRRKYYPHWWHQGQMH